MINTPTEVAAQAIVFNNKFYGDNNQLTVSSDFVQRFCKRNNISSKRLHRERNSADHDSVDSFLLEFQAIRKDYSLDQIFNADE